MEFSDRKGSAYLDPLAGLGGMPASAEGCSGEVGFGGGNPWNADTGGIGNESELPGLRLIGGTMAMSLLFLACCSTP